MDAREKVLVPVRVKREEKALELEALPEWDGSYEELRRQREIPRRWGCYDAS